MRPEHALFQMHCESEASLRKPFPGEGWEWVVAPLADAKKSPSALSTLKDRWNREAVADFEKMRSRHDGKDSFSMEVRFTGGGASVFLFVKESLSTYELNSELRSAFGDAMKSALEAEKRHAVPARLDVRALTPGDASRVIRGVALLGGTITWKPASYGARVAKKGGTKASLSCGVVTRLAAREVEGLALRAKHEARANCWVRTLAELPANELTPVHYRKHVAEFARRAKLKLEFWDTRKLAKMKAGAFLAVARADLSRGAGIAHLVYRPAGAARGKRKRLALVGKGLCFDTGGYNVKVGDSMFGMHGDMTGSAVALALCGYFAEIRAPFEVHAFLALAENLISPEAYKPNEVVIASDGTSVEVIDTDAEGRMVLADTLVAARRVKPDLALDFATLTGAAIRSLDRLRSAVFSNREELAELAVEVGNTSGERTWNFPIGGDYRKALKSEIADIAQCGPGSNADHIYAATFLSHFIGDEVPWVHMDLSAAKNKGGLGIIASDTTGFGVFWASEFVEKAMAESR